VIFDAGGAGRPAAPASPRAGSSVTMRPDVNGRGDLAHRVSWPPWRGLKSSAIPRTRHFSACVMSAASTRRPYVRDRGGRCSELTTGPRPDVLRRLRSAAIPGLLRRLGREPRASALAGNHPQTDLPWCARKSSLSEH
jgi:hypothetical protein